MKKLNKETIIISIILSILLITIGVTHVISNTRRITPTQDTSKTFIWNSNGKCWIANADNIQTAINDIGIDAGYEEYGDPHAIIDLPGNTTIICSAEIEIKDHCVLNLNGCELNFDANVNCILMRTGASIINGVINVSGVSNFDKSCIHYDCDGHSIGSRNHVCSVKDMTFVSSGGRGICIYLNTSDDYASESAIYKTNYKNIQMEGFEYGIFINHTKDGSDYSSINSNRFLYGTITNCTYGIKVYNYDEEASANIFICFDIYCNESTECIVWNNGIATIYDNINAHNWDNNSGIRTSYNFSNSIKGAHTDYYPAHQCFINIFGGCDDLSIGTYGTGNRYTLLNRENSSFWIGNINDM